MLVCERSGSMSNPRRSDESPRHSQVITKARLDTIVPKGQEILLEPELGEKKLERG